MFDEKIFYNILLDKKLISKYDDWIYFSDRSDVCCKICKERIYDWFDLLENRKSDKEKHMLKHLKEWKLLAFI